MASIMPVVIRKKFGMDRLVFCNLQAPRQIFIDLD